MNVFDFDKTIYKKDCSVEFYKYIIKRKPWILLRCLPGQLMAAVSYKLGRITKEKFKERYFSFLQYIDTELLADKFAEQELSNMAPWYLAMKREDDVIISASPAFLVTAFAKKLDIMHVLATDMNPHTGKINGANCRGQEKVVRFKKVFAEAVDNFYSDSISDTPMAKEACVAYLVKKGKPEVWNV